MAQGHSAYGREEMLNEHIAEIRPSTEQLKTHHRELLRIQRKFGIPSLNDSCRTQKIELILHEMAEDGKLEFHPPNEWRLPKR